MRIVIQRKRHKVWATKKRDYVNAQIAQVELALMLEQMAYEQATPKARMN